MRLKHSCWGDKKLTDRDNGELRLLKLRYCPDFGKINQFQSPHVPDLAFRCDTLFFLFAFLTRVSSFVKREWLLRFVLQVEPNFAPSYGGFLYLQRLHKGTVASVYLISFFPLRTSLLPLPCRSFHSPNSEIFLWHHSFTHSKRLFRWIFLTNSTPSSYPSRKRSFLRRLLPEMARLPLKKFHHNRYRTFLSILKEIWDTLHTVSASYLDLLGSSVSHYPYHVCFRPFLFAMLRLT